MHYLDNYGSPILTETASCFELLRALLIPAFRLLLVLWILYKNSNDFCERNTPIFTDTKKKLDTVNHKGL